MADIHGKRVLLIDPNDARREVLARRMHAQGYVVEHTAEATVGAEMALAAPPAAVIADLWMPSVSGLQLCRLLRAEPATMDVPVILCGERDEPRNHFWAERAGAVAYVLNGRTGDLVRALGKAVSESEGSDAFFVQLSGGGLDIRDRIARHLDTAIFESVIAAEVRALATAGSFERLFDLLAQFLSQVVHYRWMALCPASRHVVAIHHHPSSGATAEHEAREQLGVEASVPLLRIEDGDAGADTVGPSPLSFPVHFGGVPVARLVLALRDDEHDGAAILPIVARELGSAVKMAVLVEEARLLATTDALTGLTNRRAFVDTMRVELARSSRYRHSLSVLLLDIDHFKKINDTHGHGAGDQVLAAMGALLKTQCRTPDLAARWGGEEFVLAYVSTDLSGARAAAERLRAAIEHQDLRSETGEPIPVTASIGLVDLQSGESLESLVDRADRAMYASKNGGRNRVTVVAPDAVGRTELAAA